MFINYPVWRTANC